jgi:nicotinate phosphoribosyltransferase
VNTVPWVDGRNAPLLTDLYELTMLDAYLDAGVGGEATFELFVRRLPPERAFLVAAGVDDALALIESFAFADAAVEALSGLGVLSARVLETLQTLRFTGDAWAVPEGEIVFAGEPLLRVTGPLLEAQVLETLLLNTVLFQSMVASKAARVTRAAAGRPWADFSARRDHGADAALKAARAAYLGGAASTSNVLAAATYGIPASGTMAHSFVLSFEDEEEAFRAYAERFQESAILLIDTYDTFQGAVRAARVSSEFLARGVRLRGVRIDSGELGPAAREVRGVLDVAGQSHLGIFVSGDLDEYAIDALVRPGAPIDSFGVGTRLGTSEDAPSLSGVYKLVENHLGPRAKYSEGKATIPGAKQVWRYETRGQFARDVLTKADETEKGARPLLSLAIDRGARVQPASALWEARERVREGVAALPDSMKTIRREHAAYEPEVSRALSAVADSVARSLRTHRITS